MINRKYFLALTGGGMYLSQDNGATLHYSRVKTRIAELRVATGRGRLAMGHGSLAMGRGRLVTVKRQPQAASRKLKLETAT